MAMCENFCTALSDKCLLCLVMSSVWDRTRSPFIDDNTYGFETPFLARNNLPSSINELLGDRSSVFINFHDIPDIRSGKPQKGRDWNSRSYPAWKSTPDAKVPITIDEIANIFGDMRRVFGFQYDSMRNMFDHLMVMLDSRASRMGTQLALVTLHADYIGGFNANFRRWYFASQLDMDDAVGFENVDLHGNLIRSKMSDIQKSI